MAIRYREAQNTYDNYKKYEEKKDMDDHEVKQAYYYEVYGRAFKTEEAAKMWLKFRKIANLYYEEDLLSKQNMEHIVNWAYDNIEDITEILK